MLLVRRRRQLQLARLHARCTTRLHPGKFVLPLVQLRQSGFSSIFGLALCFLKFEQTLDIGLDGFERTNGGRNMLKYSRRKQGIRRDLDCPGYSA